MVRVVRTQGKGSQQLKVALAGLKDKTGKVGFFESAKYEDGTPVAYVATIQEYGSPAQGIPARPFMRPTVTTKRQEWRMLAMAESKAVVNGQSDTTRLMERLTLKASGDVVETISTVTSPALKESTIKARLRSRADGKTVGNLTKPLIDSGLMVASVSSVVEDKV